MLKNFKARIKLMTYNSKAHGFTITPDVNAYNQMQMIIYIYIKYNF